MRKTTKSKRAFNFDETMFSFGRKRCKYYNVTSDVITSDVMASRRRLLSSSSALHVISSKLNTNGETDCLPPPLPKSGLWHSNRTSMDSCKHGNFLQTIIENFLYFAAVKAGSVSTVYTTVVLEAMETLGQLKSLCNVLCIYYRQLMKSFSNQDIVERTEQEHDSLRPSHGH